MKRLDWPSEAAGSHRELLQVLGNLPGALVASVRALALRDGAGRWMPYFLRIDVARPGDVEEGPRYVYKHGVRTLSETLPLTEFVQRFGTMLESDQHFACEDVQLIRDRLTGTWSADRLDSGDAMNDYTPWPCLHAQCAVGQPILHDDQAGPLLTASGAASFHSELLGLVGEIAAFGKFRDHFDGRRTGAHLIVWDYRGRISEVECLQDSLRLKIDGTERDRLVLVGRVSAQSGSAPLRMSAEPSLEIALPADCIRVHVALVGEDDAIRDARDFNNYPAWVEGRSREDGGNDVGQLLLAGETSHVEIKKWISIGDHEKMQEVFDTVTAMANTKGGTILVGADSLGRLHWDGKVLGWLPTASSDGEQTESEASVEGRRHAAVQAYGRRLCDRIQTILNRSVGLTPSPVQMSDGWILRIEVEEGPMPPYRVGVQGSILVRHSASNRWPTDDELAGLTRHR